jgi:hypothetical protein
MFRHTVLGLVAALGFAAAPAAAETIQSFSDLCLDARGDRADAGTRAKAAGWTQLPTEDLNLGGDLNDPSLFISLDPAKMSEDKEPPPFEMMMTGWGSAEQVFKAGSMTIDACAVMSESGTVETLKGGMEALLGAPPIDMNGQAAWFVSRSGDGMVAETELDSFDDEDLLRLLQQRKLYVVTVLNEGQMAGLLLGAIRQAP